MMKRNSLRDEIGKKVLLFDGGMGSMIISAGLGRNDVPEAWNITNPEAIIDMHAAFIEAGAEIVQTNTFGGSRLKLESSDAGRALDPVEVNEKAVELGRRALDRHGGEGCFLGGDIGPTGLFFPPVGTLTAREAHRAFKEQAQILERAGIDCFIIETMYDIREAMEALRAVREITDRPAFVEITFETKPSGYFTMMGDSPEKIAEPLLAAGADMIGANCTISSSEMIDLVEEFTLVTDAPLLFQPNAGNPAMEHGIPVYRQRPQEFADDIEKIVRAGASAVGGCCGTTPDFIRAVHDRLTHGR
ncbi:MAG: homocysteine S-methyltransferase family protein [bacterium]|nr:MAG: homocysteine S-methyltransferase family protein [bacterium]